MRYFCVGCRPRRTVRFVGGASVEIGFGIKVRSGTADLKIRTARSVRLMDNRDHL